MPDVDVTDLLSDLDFVETFTVLRNVETVNASGVATVAPQTFWRVSGVVQPQDSSVLVRVPDGSLMAGDIVIYTQFELTAGKGSIQADIVKWRCVNYTVYSVDDWSAYGDGYFKAVCRMQTVNP